MAKNLLAINGGGCYGVGVANWLTKLLAGKQPQKLAEKRILENRNIFKPRVTVKNTGSVALSDYHAQLWFRVPQGKSLFPLEIWYAPESSPSVKNAGGRVRVLDLHFNKHILYPGDSVSEGNVGLNLADWSAFDKTVCGIVLRDKDGNILFGREPSVAECESYNGPNLLQPLYSRKE